MKLFGFKLDGVGQNMVIVSLEYIHWQAHVLESPAGDMSHLGTLGFEFIFCVHSNMSNVY